MPQDVQFDDVLNFEDDYFGEDDSFKSPITPGTYIVKVDGFESKFNEKTGAVGIQWYLTTVKKLTDMDGIELPEKSTHEAFEDQMTGVGYSFKHYTYLGRKGEDGVLREREYGRNARNLIKMLGYTPETGFQMTREDVQNRQVIMTLIQKKSGEFTNVEPTKVVAMETPGEKFTGVLPNRTGNNDNYVPF